MTDPELVIPNIRTLSCEAHLFVHNSKVSQYVELYRGRNSVCVNGTLSLVIPSILARRDNPLHLRK